LDSSAAPVKTQANNTVRVIRKKLNFGMPVDASDAATKVTLPITVGIGIFRMNLLLIHPQRHLKSLTFISVS
jgi:hypothetical protein